MKRTLAALAFIAALTGCSVDEYKNVKLVKQQLNDPDSAQIEEVRTVGGMTCGLVNAKNLYGAYTGFERFFVVDRRVYFGSDAMQPSINNPGVCSHEAQMRDIDRALRELRQAHGYPR
jgi:hypothetical protein